MHITHELTITELPQACIDDCSAAGDVYDAVAYWVADLPFTVDRANAIRCLREYGAWEDDELTMATDESLAQRILWLACCDFHEYQQEVAAGRGGQDAHAGSDVFWLG